MAGDEEVEMVKFSFFVPKNLEADLRRVVARYRDTKLDVEWQDSDAGQENLKSVLATLPSILTHVRSEMAIKREVASLDRDLEELNGDE